MTEKMPDPHPGGVDPDDCASTAHQWEIARLAEALRVDPREGLSADECHRRRLSFGPNLLPDAKNISRLRILLNQLRSAVVALLVVAAVLAMVYREWTEGLAIAVVLLINTTIGFVSELRAMRSMEALRKMGTISARVRREGRILEVPAEELVTGDIVLLEGGDVVPADIRLIEASNLAVDQSALTGESEAVDKTADGLAEEVPLADRSCMVFMGTAVNRGSATGLVTGIASNTELGRIASLVEQAAPERSPMEKQIARLGGQLVWVTLLCVVLIAGVGIATGKDWFLMIEAAISLAVAAIPEGLPIVATLALARGMWRMAKQNAVVEKLSAVETLGATTVICTDKTGTLTENKMNVKRLVSTSGAIEFDHNLSSFKSGEEQVLADGNELLREMLITGALCNRAELASGSIKGSGDPMELALLEVAQAADISRPSLDQAMKKIEEYAFSTETKMMAVSYTRNGSVIYFVKGAPEAVVRHSTAVRGPAGTAPMTDELREHWNELTQKLAQDGLRVLGLAQKSTRTQHEEPYTDLELLGLVGLHDPPRQDVKQAITASKRAGIRVVMVTGDHPATARNIALAVGLASDDTEVVQGSAISPWNRLSEQQRQTILNAEIFSRATPEQKYDLVAVYQQAGEIVAMTGDGVNDAPALKRADIGVAMGLRGTQVARQAAAMVLRDDAFATIVLAIREGRVIFRNIQRFVGYLLSCNLGEILVIGLAVLAGMPLPILPLQILFLNLVTDVFPAFALGAGAGDADILKRPPRDPGKPLVTRSIWLQIIGNGSVIALVTLLSFYLANSWLGLGGYAATTVSFLTISLAQLWNVFNMRDPRSRMLLNDITRNPYVWAALALCVILLLAAVYVPSIAMVLSLERPSGLAWGLVLTLSLVPLLIGQAGKFLSRRMAGHHP